MASILTVNAGSTSLKFALFENGGVPSRAMWGKIERIGLQGTKLHLSTADGPRQSWELSAKDHEASLGPLFDRLGEDAAPERLGAVAHRIVHGGRRFRATERVSPDMLEHLRRIRFIDPQHLPAEIQLVEIFQRRFPAVPQVACFDTAFHRAMPKVAKLLPIPRRYFEMGVERYGFHGLSYEYLLAELARIGEPGEARGRLILAHLGGGASLAAVRDGKPMDTTMALTPASGLVMGTRSGDMDPGLPAILAVAEGMTAEQFQDLVNSRSGLLGVSERSSDLRDLLSVEHEDAAAAEAVELFCYQAKKWIGAFAAVLGGLDTLVFSGGIGENSPEARARICAGLDFLGLALDPAQNQKNAKVISREGSRARVRVIPTDEEVTMARRALQLLHTTPRGTAPTIL